MKPIASAGTKALENLEPNELSVQLGEDDDGGGGGGGGGDDDDDDEEEEEEELH